MQEARGDLARPGTPIVEKECPLSLAGGGKGNGLKKK